MSEETMLSLTIRPLAGGGLELEQGDSLDDPAVIHLHPAQVRLIAERASIPERHADCVRTLADWFRYFDEFHTDNVTNRCGVEEGLCLKAIRECVDELMIHIGDEQRTREKPPKRPHERPGHGTDVQLPLLAVTSQDTAASA